jgi:hypothetical protein
MGAAGCGQNADDSPRLGRASSALADPPIQSSGAGVGFPALEGYADPEARLATRAIHLSDFYNPHAFDATYHPDVAASDDRLFPPGSAYGAGAPKPTVLLVDVSAGWCDVCQHEAKVILPSLHEKYAPCGGQVLLLLADGPRGGIAATPSDLLAWVRAFRVDYPAGIARGADVRTLFRLEAFPTNLIIDTTTMRIVEVANGVPPEGDPFWEEYERHLDTASAGCHVK